MQQPAFWYHPAPTWQARLLWPLAWLYGTVSRLNVARRAWHAVPLDIPLVSIGNLTVGGSGKTPLTLEIAAHFARLGQRVAVVACGSGGSRRVPLQVTSRHTAAEVGDEACLLALRLPEVAVWTGPSKAATVQAAARMTPRPSLIVLDDGFQRRDIPRSANLLVVGPQGLGNGLCLPAGPLREPAAAAACATCAVLMGGAPRPASLPRHVPTFRLTPVLCPDAVQRMQGKPVVALAGIAHPQAFFSALRAAGLEVLAAQALPDHAAPSPALLERLQATARQHGAVLVCTEKDMPKLPANAAVAIPLVLPPAEVAPLLAYLETYLDNV